VNEQVRIWVKELPGSLLEYVQGVIADGYTVYWSAMSNSQGWLVKDVKPGQNPAKDPGSISFVEGLPEKNGRAQRQGAFLYPRHDRTVHGSQPREVTCAANMNERYLTAHCSQGRYGSLDASTCVCSNPWRSRTLRAVDGPRSGSTVGPRTTLTSADLSNGISVYGLNAAGPPG
jgi:hypothetical protein